MWKTIGKGEIQSKYGGYVGSYKNVVPYGKGTIIKSAIAKTNTIWASQDVGGKMTLAGHKSIDFSSYSSAWSAGWKSDLVSALMNHTDTSTHSELQGNLTSIMNE